MKMIKNLIVCVVCLLALWSCLTLQASAQTANDVKRADRLFSGFWVNKKTKRHLLISVEENKYLLINDWTGNSRDLAVIDAYKAFIKRGMLVMPADIEHHAPYAEMQIINKRLYYITKFKDIEGKLIVDTVVFVREKQ